MRKNKFIAKKQNKVQSENVLNFLFQSKSRLSIETLYRCTNVARIEELKISHLGTFKRL